MINPVFVPLRKTGPHLSICTVSKEESGNLRSKPRVFDEISKMKIASNVYIFTMNVAVSSRNVYLYSKSDSICGNYILKTPTN